MSTDIDIHDHYLNGSLLADIPENLREFLAQEEDLSIEEAIFQQASVYQSYQEHGMNRDDDNYSDSSSPEDEGEPSAHLTEDEDESSRPESVTSQEAMDEAYARFLQELEEEFGELIISESSGSANSTTESHIATPMEQEASPQLSHDANPELSQDDVDPDNMRYEELLNLTETVGVESVGLSATHISQLPSFIYTFSKNKEENCVVCQDSFKFGKRLTTLPCSHLYHSKCIGEWLKLKKNCPICQKDVV